jgi:hypothetical protein
MAKEAFLTVEEWNRPMTARDFNVALKELGLSVYASPGALGVSLRQAQRYSAGEPVAWPVANNVRMLVWNVQSLKARRRSLLAQIGQFEHKGVRTSTNGKDDTAATVKRLRAYLTEIEDLLNDHPAGVKPGLD